MNSRLSAPLRLWPCSLQRLAAHPSAFAVSTRRSELPAWTAHGCRNYRLCTTPGGAFVRTNGRPPPPPPPPATTPTAGLRRPDRQRHGAGGRVDAVCRRHSLAWLRAAGGGAATPCVHLKRGLAGVGPREEGGRAGHREGGGEGGGRRLAGSATGGRVWVDRGRRGVRARTGRRVAGACARPTPTRHGRGGPVSAADRQRLRVAPTALCRCGGRSHAAAGRLRRRRVVVGVRARGAVTAADVVGDNGAAADGWRRRRLQLWRRGRRRLGACE